MTEKEWIEINKYIYIIAKELEELQKFCEEHKVPFEPPYTVISDVPLTNDKD